MKKQKKDSGWSIDKDLHSEYEITVMDDLDLIDEVALAECLEDEDE